MQILSNVPILFPHVAELPDGLLFPAKLGGQTPAVLRSTENPSCKCEYLGQVVETRYAFHQWEKVLSTYSYNTKQTAQDKSRWKDSLFHEVYFASQIFHHNVFMADEVDTFQK